VDYDASTGNLLFRTGDPLVHDQTAPYDPHGVDFEALMAQFKTATEAAGAEWPADYFVQDFSLWTGETDYIAAEKQYWDTHPDLGNVTHWPINGMSQGTLQAGCKKYNISACADSTNQPQTMADTDVLALGQNYLEWGDTDDLSNRLAALNKVLHTKLSKPQVLFFHCTCGCDRTGEFYAAYAIEFLNRTWTEAMAYDVKLIDRNPMYTSMVMSQWYCEFLSATGQYGHSDCGNCSPFECSDPFQLVGK
jgi:hypothetical protein